VLIVIVAFISGSIFGEALHHAPEIDISKVGDSPASYYRSLPNLTSAYYDFTPDKREDGLNVGGLPYDGEIGELAKGIAKGKYGQYDSLLISRGNKLVFESYFHKGRVNLPHYQASATKGYTSFAVGRAIQLGYLSMDDLHKPVLEFLKEVDAHNLTNGVEKITLHHTLSMRSGLRLTKEHIKTLSKAPESIKGQKLAQAYFTYSEPVTEQSQTYQYQSIDTRITMLVLDSVVPQTAKKFIQFELLDKLNISNFSWEDNDSGFPESAHSASMTSRDMIKFGTLLKQNGMWNEEPLISKEYLTLATSHVATPYDEEDDYSNFRYGYYFWGTKLKVQGKEYDAKMAWGGGAQFVITVNALDLVVAVTANIRDKDQTFSLLEKYILPTFVQIESLNQKESIVLNGPYLGQSPPGSKPEIFAPGIVNTNKNREVEGMFAADMNTFYFIRRPLGEKPESNVLLSFEYINNQWQKSIVKKGKSEASISPDGKRIYFKNTFMEKNSDGWSDVTNIGAPFDEIDIMRLSVSATGTYYFDTFNKKLDMPIRYSRLIDGKYEQPISLGPQFGIGQYNAHPYIAPDESYIIFDSKRKGGYGSSDLYISFRMANDSWSPAINLGDQVNTSDPENYPSVSPDGKFLFFDRRSEHRINGDKHVDIYWVDAKVIDELAKNNNGNEDND
jgi:CubicO group peptidase (beta-lactamase class C family)